MSGADSLPNYPGHGQVNHEANVPNMNDPWNEKAALGFDGGGVRGYWSLLVLQTLMEKVQKREKELDKKTPHSFHPCERPDSVSHLPVEHFTPFLPCHYFDYIGGTSTGALISIMLSGFRMTVEDCMHEYETMAGKIFGKPRKYNAMWNPLTDRSKFSAEDLKSAIRNVIRRRAEGTLHSPDLANVLFKTEFETCRGLVLSLEDGSASHKLVRIRSYVYNSPSRHGGASTTSPGVQLNNAVLSVDMAARAATAAFLYFDRLEIKIPREQHRNLQRIATSYQPVEGKPKKASKFRFWKRRNESPSEQMTLKLSDAGFGKYNNPCEEIIWELDKLHERPSITLVSIGTARPEKVDTQRRVLTAVARKALESNGDPEGVHKSIQERGEERIDYLRLNSPGGLELDMDDWRPKKTGEKTLDEIRRAFSAWRGSDGISDDIARCADKLVQLRRRRASGDEDKWKRFALGQYYVCLRNGCEGEDLRFRARAEFEAHLKQHTSRDEMEAKLTAGTRIWEYRPLLPRPWHRADT